MQKNWDINEWRKEYPVDYFNLSAMLVKPDEAILRDEAFLKRFIRALGCISRIRFISIIL